MKSPVTSLQSPAKRVSMSRSYKKLNVWQKAVDFSLLIYKATENFPKHEQFGLTSQIRRAAVSIAANIAEGSERGSDKEFCRFLNIARGSLAECETHSVIALQLGFLSEADYNAIQEVAGDLGRMLNGLAKKLETGDRRLETVNA